VIDAASSLCASSRALTRSVPKEHIALDAAMSEIPVTRTVICVPPTDSANDGVAEVASSGDAKSRKALDVPLVLPLANIAALLTGGCHIDMATRTAPLG
jgi:hypothetical protein